MAEYTAGSASVPVTPDLSDFHKKIAAELDGLDAQFAKAGDSGGASFGDAFSARVKASFADLPKATVNADADTTAAEAKLDALTKKPRSVTVKVKEVADKVSSKTGTLGGVLTSKVGLGALGAVALGPQAVGAAAGVAGIGTAFGAAAADAGAFGIIAKGMFGDVTTAQAALTKAQDDYNAATTSSGRAKALADEKAALDGLTPSEKALATQLTALQGAWTKLNKAEQPAVGAAIAPWLKTATSGMQLLSPLIEDGAGAIQLLGEDADKAFQSPFWNLFAGTLGATGQIALTNFGEAAGKVGDGLAHLFVAFSPDIDKLPPLVNDLAGAFDKWASSVTDKGLDDFLAKTFTPDNLSLLAKDGKSLESLLTNIAKATGGMSPLAFTGLSNVLTVLGKLTPTEIEALTGLFLAIKGIGTISKGVSAVTSIIKGAKSIAGKIGGLFGGGASAAESTAAATESGTEAGGAAAKAYTAAFTEGVTAGLAEAFGTIEGEGTAEATAAGTSWGGEAAGGFTEGLTGGDALGLAAAFTTIGGEGTAEATAAGTAWGGEAAAGFTGGFTGADSLGLAAAFAGIGLEGTPLANAAGVALGGSFAAGFGEGIAGVGSGLLGSLGLGAGLSLLAATAAGAALGGAVGLGFTGALALTGASGAVGQLSNSVQAAAASANTWLQPAGQQAGQGFINGLNSEAAAVQAAAAALKNSVTSGTNGSQSWIQPAGQQAGTGFDTGLSSLHDKINATAASIKSWVTGALPSPASWLVNIGVDAVQGLANGLIASAGLIEDAVTYLASLIPNTIKSLLGIGSPSKVAHQLGMFTGQGFGLGLASQNSFVGAQAGQLAMTSAQSLAGVASAQSLSALGSLGVPSISAAPRLPGVSSPLSGAPLQLQLSYAGTGNQLTDALVGALQGHIQGTAGGDVQAALGRGQVRI